MTIDYNSEFLEVAGKLRGWELSGRAIHAIAVTVGSYGEPWDIAQRLRSCESERQLWYIPSIGKVTVAEVLWFMKDCLLRRPIVRQGYSLSDDPRAFEQYGIKRQRDVAG